MKAFHAIAVGLTTAFMFAGCLNETPILPGDAPASIAGSPFPPFVPPAPTFDFSHIVDPDHKGHDVPLLHTASHGLKAIGMTSMGSILPPGTKGSITQIDVWQDYAVVAGMEGGPAFIIVDISDPAAPKPVSYAPTTADGWTARFSKDGAYVFYGCQVIGPPFGTGGVLKGTCEDAGAVTGETATDSGVSVWDVQDKKKPVFVDFIKTGGSHNIYAQAIDGVDYVFTSAVTILKFDREAGQLSEIAALPGTHDVTVQKHPVTGDWLLYTGTKNLAIWNVNDPANPQNVLEAGAFPGSEGVGWHDQVAFPYLVDGRALLALAGETFGTSPIATPLTSGAGGVPDKITFVDVTDPSKPVKLSQWAPPFAGAKDPWISYAFSAHEMAATPQGQLAVSWYHGGVWVLDVSTTERQEKPIVLGAFQPSEPVNIVPSAFAQTPQPLVPFVWSAAWDQRGYLIVPDMHTGVYILEPAWGLRALLDSGA